MMKFLAKHNKIMSLKFLISKSVKWRILLLFISFSWVALAQPANTDNGFVVDKIIAKVDNYIVLKSELERAYQDYITNGGTPSQEARCQYLAILIRNKLMVAKAETDSVLVDDSQVDDNMQRRFDMILGQYGGSTQQIEAVYGKGVDQIKADLFDQIKEQLVVQKMQEEITKDVTVTPAEVKRFFNNIPKDSIPYLSAEVEISQIVRVAKVSTAQKEQTKNQLIDLRTRIVNGEDFATLAKKYSADPSVVANGGDMGFVGRGMMVPEFEAMSFKLKPGEISLPVETDFGFHIIQLLERRGNEYHSRHILMSPTPSDQDLRDATRYLDSLRSLIEKDSIKFTMAAKEYSDDVQTKNTGGYFSDPEGGTFLSVDELDPVVFFNIDTMKVGNISKPIAYRTDQQKDAVRILYYKSRIPPHQASLKDDWNKIEAYTLNEKKNRILYKWFEKARKDVFINIDPTYDYCGLLN
jgi:peptidyl-prolyl cis-trans isomerase SurA